MQALDYAYELIHLDPPVLQAVGHAIAVFQADIQYSTRADLIFSEDWTGFSTNALSAADFIRRAGPGPNAPDFSANGAALTFGYFSANANSGGAPNVTRISGFDNWQVTLVTVPLPASLWLFASAWPLLRRRRKVHAA